MNWVGGSRSRMIFKQERQKQREFFEKQKMKSKLKLLDSTCATKPSLSLDLLNLHVINQISKKKENITHPKHIDMCKRKETFSDHVWTVQLPMSPITVPSKICLDDSEIISSQTKTVECRRNESLHTNISEEEPEYEKEDMTTEAKSRNDFLSESSGKQTRLELGTRHPYSLYDKCSASNKKGNKVKFPSKLSLFDILSSDVHKLNESVKQDMSVQCNFEKEPKFMGYFNNNPGIESVNFSNNSANVETTRRQNSPQFNSFES